MVFKLKVNQNEKDLLMTMKEESYQLPATKKDN